MISSRLSVDSMTMQTSYENTAEEHVEEPIEEDLEQPIEEHVKRRRLLPLAASLIAIAITGSAAVFGWRTYASLPPQSPTLAAAGTDKQLEEMIRDLKELKQDIEQVKANQQQMAQSAATLQAAQRDIQKRLPVEPGRQGWFSDWRALSYNFGPERGRASSTGSIPVPQQRASQEGQQRTAPRHP
jgi:hypothetical protein